MIRMSVMIEGLVARGVVTVRGASGVPAGPFYHVLPISGHTSSLVWCGPFRPRIIPRPEGVSAVTMSEVTKSETWMFLSCDSDVTWCCVTRKYPGDYSIARSTDGFIINSVRVARCQTTSPVNTCTVRCG